MERFDLVVDDVREAGGNLFGVAVDEQKKQDVLAQELHLKYRLVSDPELLLAKHFGVVTSDPGSVMWTPKTHAISQPAIAVIASHSRETACFFWNTELRFGNQYGIIDRPEPTSLWSMVLKDFVKTEMKPMSQSEVKDAVAKVEMQGFLNKKW